MKTANGRDIRPIGNLKKGGMRMLQRECKRLELAKVSRFPVVGVGLERCNTDQ